MRRDDEKDYRWWWGGGGPEILESMATVIYGVFWHRTEKSLRPSSRNSGNQFSRNTIPLTPAIPNVKSKSSNTGDVMIDFHS